MQWEDLDRLLVFINNVVGEKKSDSRSPLYTGFDQKVSREEEAQWLAETLASIERGDVINVLAQVRNRIIANGEVTKGTHRDTFRHGRLGLTLLAKYRGLGVGRRMIEILVKESRRAGLKNLEVEFLAGNVAARRTYERQGFKEAAIIPKKVSRIRKYFDGLIMSREL